MGGPPQPGGWARTLLRRTSSVLRRDGSLVRHMGYRQELKRDMNVLSSFGLSFSIISILTGVCGTYSSTALVYGGPASITLGWPLVSCFSLLVALALAEICSAYPTAGGLYFWAAALARPGWAPFASFVAGYFNLLGQLALTAGVAFTAANFLALFITLASGGVSAGGVSSGAGFVFNNQELLGLYAAVLVLAGAVNSGGVRLVHLLSLASTAWHVGGTLLLLLFLPAAAVTHQPAAWVFTGFNNSGATTGISSPATNFLLGLLASQWTLVGYDASAHLSEETVNAAVAGPLGIVSSVAVSAVVGWGFVLALTWSIQGDPARLLAADTDTGGLNGCFQIIIDVVTGRWGASRATLAGSLLLVSIPLLAALFCCLLSVASNSRMMFAFSRDGALPGSRFLLRVHGRSAVPLNAVWASAGCAFLLGVPMLVNVTAFNAVVSLGTTGTCISYAIPIAAKLMSGSWRPGPFSLGRLSVPIGALSVAWVGFICAIFFMPTVLPVDPLTNLNYAPITVGVVLIGVLAGWLLSARRWFKGPQACEAAAAARLPDTLARSVGSADAGSPGGGADGT